MSTPVYEFPHDWYAYIVTRKFRVRSASQSAARAFIGAKSVKGPHAQFWLVDMTMAPLPNPLRQDMSAFFTRLAGQAGLLRIGDPDRIAPWYDRNLTSPTITGFTDGTEFSDGTGFADGFLPPQVYVATAAAQRTNYIVMTGFPVSTANVIRRGDLLQVKPNGVDGVVPHLYEAQFSCSSDSSGRVGVEISPMLRTAIAAGDTVSLRFPSTVFRLIDDTQGEMEVSGTDNVGNFGFSLIEALDQVP